MEPFVQRIPFADLDAEQREAVEHGDVPTRIMCALNGLGHDKLYSDENRFVKDALASTGYGFILMAENADPAIRAIAAMQGYGLDRLLEDESLDVRVASFDFLKANSITFDQYMDRYPDRTIAPKKMDKEREDGIRRSIAELSREARARAAEHNVGGNKRDIPKRALRFR